MTMPAVVLTTQGRIELQDRPRPTLRPDQVLVEVDLCGVADLTTVISPLPDALTAFDALRAGQIMKALIAPGTRP